jgi:hypothetical protein
MKQLTNAKTILAGAILLGLVISGGAVTGGVTWMAAGIMGLAALGFIARQPQPKLAPVRIRSQKRR